jgi:hypothetical protein
MAETREAIFGQFQGGTGGMRVSVLGPDPIGAFVDGWLLAKLAVARAPVVSMSTPTAERLAVLAGRVCGGYGFTVQTAIPGVAAERVDGYIGVDLMISEDVPDGWVMFR